MKKKFVMFLLSASVMFGAELVNGIAFTVNESAVTLFELYKTMGEYKLSRDDAMAMLVDKVLQQEALEKYSVNVSDAELESEAARVASENGMDLFAFKKALRDRGIDWSAYSKDLREKLKKENLYRRIASEKIKMADEEELKNYYNMHLNDFSIPRSIDTTKYFSASKEALAQKLQNPSKKISGVESEDEIIPTSQLNPQFLQTLVSTNEGDFTPIITVQSTYLSFKINKKLDVKAVDFDRAKNMIFSKLMSEREDRIIADYFQKQRALAKVNIIRLQ